MKRFLMVCVMVLCVALIVIAGTQHAYADSGTYDGIDWDLTDGVLTLGNGGTQTLENRSERYSFSWPWTGPNSTITSVVTNGKLVLQGSLQSMFYCCYGLTSVDVLGWDTSNVTTMVDMFQDCRSLISLDLSLFNTSNVTNISEMFWGCTSLTSLNLSGWDTSNVTAMSNMFRSCSSLTSLDISGFDTSNVTNMDNMFFGCSRLRSVKLGENNPFRGSGTSITLPTPPASQSGITYTRKWIQEDKTFGPFTPAELRDNYTSDMAGTWVWEIAPTEYTLAFTASDYPEATGFMANETPVAKEDFSLPANQFVLFGYTFDHWDDGNGHTYVDGAVIPANTYEAGSTVTFSAVLSALPEYTIAFNADSYSTAAGAMPNVTVLTTEAYQIPANQFVLFGFSFDHWDDGNGHTYVDQGTIPANTYTAGVVVDLSAVMIPRDTSVSMKDGSFDFSIKGNEKAFFSPVPANTTYQVYEQTPFGWNLIKQIGNVGEIMPDEESEALFLNQYDPLKVTIRFAGTKLMDESAADSDSFNFLLYEDETLIDIASVSEGGAIEFQPIEYDAAGDHHYYIKEVIGSDNTVEYDTHVEEITVSITSDGVGHLGADVTMDEDQILFKNESKPGMLALRKLNATTEDRDGMFYYEVQFVTQNGQPYELAESELSYEEREGVVSEYPDLQPLSEKQKYTLTVAYQRLNPDGTVKSEQTSAYEYYAGDMFELNDLGYSGYRYQTAVGLPVMRVGNVFKGVMGNGDSRVEIKYEPLRTATIDKVKWQKSVNGSGLPLRTASSFRQNTAYSSVNDLPLDAVRIDDMTTDFSVYFWNDGDNAYWWSDAETVYLPANASYMFDSCSSLTFLDVSGFDTSKVTTMQEMFDGCASLTLLDLSGFDTSNVTNMHQMFCNCRSLTSLDVSNFNTSNVTDVEQIFYNCRGLTSLDVSGWDVSNVPDMYGVFSSCSGLTSLDLSRWNPSKATSLLAMFFGCTGLTSLDLSGWDTSSVTNMNEVFYYCTGLTSLNLSGWDTSNVRAMYAMFEGCSGLTSLDLSGFDTSNVTTMQTMFEKCTSLTSLDLSTFDTSNVTEMSDMFRNCDSLASLNLSGFDTSKARYMSYMYLNCSSLKEVVLSDKYLFGGSNSALPDVPLLKDNVVYSGKWIHESGDYGPFTSTELIDNYTSEMQGKWIWQVAPREVTIAQNKWSANVNTTSSSGFSPLRSATTFSRSEDYASVDDLPSGARKIDDGTTGCSIYFWKDGTNAYWWSDADTVYLPANASYMFYNCGSLTSLDMSGFDTSKVTNMRIMFSGCSSLTSLDLSRFDTSHVTDMYGLFSSCNGLTSLDMSKFDTSNVTDMSWMFHNCASLTSLDLSGFNTSNVTDMSYMFRDCINLMSIDLFGFDTSNVTTMFRMFGNCNSICSITLGENNPFYGKTSSISPDDLPTPPTSKDGIIYTRKWIREDGTFGPFTPAELRDNYTSEMQGKWIWEVAP